MQHCTQLGDMLGNFDMISTLGIPSDVPANRTDLFAVLDMYVNTSKPLVLLISGEKMLSSVIELLTYLHGDISDKPFCIPYVNLITPLVLNKATTDKMEISIHHKLPLMFSNYSMSGGTTPASEGGTLTLLNTELLAGLVYSQLIREGSEIILGSLPGAFNMASMGSQYTTSTYVLNLACAEMMGFYEIPHCGTSGSNNGRGADLLASGDLWLNHLSSCLGKVGCAPFVGGNFDSVAFSPSTVVLSNQIIGEAREFARGFELSSETVNMEEIKGVGPGGDFFTTEQTLSSLSRWSNKDALWSPKGLEEWKAQKMPSAEKDLIEATHALFGQAKSASEKLRDELQKGAEYIRQKF
jgi:trimethylamine--corrinoid protein Co-methyltransferase